MRELLIRYLLGELGPQEQRELEARLRTSPELQRELAYLRRCFAAAEGADRSAEVRPADLAERTTRRVCQSDSADTTRDEARGASMSRGAWSDVNQPAGPLGWSLADLTVAGGVILAVGMLVLPALRDSRDASRSNACELNLQKMAVPLLTYTADHGRQFPRIRATDNAGMYAVELVERGYVELADFSAWLICPGSAAAEEIRAGRRAVQIPTRAQLAAMPIDELVEARRNMSPCYAYALPYRIGDEYYYVRDEQRRFVPVISDAWDGEPSHPMSSNHRGFFHALCSDGSVQTLMSCRVPVFGNDDVYRNQKGMVAAGCSQTDAVLGRSEATPAGMDFIARPLMLDR